MSSILSEIIFAYYSAPAVAQRGTRRRMGASPFIRAWHAPVRHLTENDSDLTN